MTFEKRVIKVVKENIEEDFEVKLDSILIEELGVDSFNKLMIIAGLEDEFSIEIKADDFSQIERVSDIVDKINFILVKEGE